MIKKKNRAAAEVNASSMADIAFLLLIFFIITSSIVNDKGVKWELPIFQEPKVLERDKRDVCLILMNKENNLLVENKRMELGGEITEYVKKHILNRGQNSELSTSPKKALVAFKVSRGANYDSYLKTVGEVKAAYFQIWSEMEGVSPEELRNWDIKNEPQLSKRLNKLKEQIPYNFSVTESDK